MEIAKFFLKAFIVAISILTYFGSVYAVVCLFTMDTEILTAAMFLAFAVLVSTGIFAWHET